MAILYGLLGMHYLCKVLNYFKIEPKITFDLSSIIQFQAFESLTDYGNYYDFIIHQGYNIKSIRV